MIDSRTTPYGALLLRLALGIMFLAHGIAKLVMFTPSGTAKYFDLIVDGEVNRNAVWYYSDPKPEAQKIRRHAAFWKGRSRGPLTLEGVGPASPRLPTKASIRHARNSAIAPRARALGVRVIEVSHPCAPTVAA